ncbi:MAG: hypothetical protein Q9157_001234 [Trypethelium eluteriae]
MTADNIVTTLRNAQKVVIVVGYGVAVAKAKYPIAEFVAGLGVDASIPYDIVLEMDEINEE